MFPWEQILSRKFEQKIGKWFNLGLGKLNVMLHIDIGMEGEGGRGERRWKELKIEDWWLGRDVLDFFDWELICHSCSPWPPKVYGRSEFQMSCFPGRFRHSDPLEIIAGNNVFVIAMNIYTSGNGCRRLRGWRLCGTKRWKWDYLNMKCGIY